MSGGQGAPTVREGELFFGLSPDFRWRGKDRSICANDGTPQRRSRPPHKDRPRPTGFRGILVSQFMASFEMKLPQKRRSAASCRSPPMFVDPGVRGTSRHYRNLPRRKRKGGRLKTAEDEIKKTHAGPKKNLRQAGYAARETKRPPEADTTAKHITGNDMTPGGRRRTLSYAATPEISRRLGARRGQRRSAGIRSVASLPTELHWVHLETRFAKTQGGRHFGIVSFGQPSRKGGTCVSRA